MKIKIILLLFFCHLSTVAWYPLAGGKTVADIVEGVAFYRLDIMYNNKLFQGKESLGWRYLGGLKQCSEFFHHQSPKFTHSQYSWAGGVQRTNEINGLHEINNSVGK